MTKDHTFVDVDLQACTSSTGQHVSFDAILRRMPEMQAEQLAATGHISQKQAPGAWKAQGVGMSSKEGALQQMNAASPRSRGAAQQV